MTLDTVSSTPLIQKKFNTNIDTPNTPTKNWLANYLTGRHAYTLYNDKPFTTKRYTNGVPQGSVLPPTLFNLYVLNIPLPAHPDTHILSYAEDITAFLQHPNFETAATHLQKYIHTETWLQTNRLKVSTTKSTLTLITPWNHEYTRQPPVTLNGELIPLIINQSSMQRKIRNKTAGL